jgi:crossover junction endodeoxyribonuclease RuvC
MKILGIDPGLAETGWAVVEQAQPAKLIAHGSIHTSKNKALVQRLSQIFDDTKEIINKYQPDHMAVENLYFSKNQKTAINVAQAMGVVKLAGRERNLEVSGYSPTNIKTAIVGHGRAQKQQVEFMVKQLLNIKKAIKPDHASDAVAVALTHMFTNNQLR